MADDGPTIRRDKVRGEGTHHQSYRLVSQQQQQLLVPIAWYILGIGNDNNN